MLVKLLHFTPLAVAVEAIRTCWNSNDKSDSCGPKDLALIERVANKNKHASTIEHLVYSFKIEGISRALLQELARHRLASFSVKSSRYTLKEVKGLTFYHYSFGVDKANLEKFCVKLANDRVQEAVAQSMQDVSDMLKLGLPNDIVKYSIPEAYKVDLVFTINARSLQNLLALRTNKAALKEFQTLANKIFNSLPYDHAYLFEASISKTNDTKLI